MRARTYHRHHGNIPMPAPPLLQYATERAGQAGFLAMHRSLSVTVPRETIPEPREHPRQRPPLAVTPLARPARHGSSAGVPRSQAQRGAAQSGHAAQDGMA
jgi:hypothetical protein